MKHIIVGTAGHIDHGKTTLIKALTGRETDTLEEEQRRGISINLGFTWFDLPNGDRVGIVDVPGHERFIKNMMAGAFGTDMVLMVVAADSGIMPQTVEHMDILTYMNIKKGIIVITKCDLVDDEMLTLVKEEVREGFRGTFLENAPMVCVDSVSRRGLDELVSMIQTVAKGTEEKNEHLPARLNIDRVFTIKGHGTVVTGTLNEGRISVGDTLEILPSRILTKVRSVQVHSENQTEAVAGQRTALNLSNVSTEDIHRGDVLTVPGELSASRMIDVKLNLLAHHDKPLTHWQRLRLFHGTREILCRAVPLDSAELQPGETGYVQLRLEDELYAKPMDPIVVRSFSPVTTIGGGIIIETQSSKHKSFDESILESLRIKEMGELKDVIRQYVEREADSYPNLRDIIDYTGESSEDVETKLGELHAEGSVIRVGSSYLSPEFTDELAKRTVEALEQYYKQNPLKSGMGKDELKSKAFPKLPKKNTDELLAVLAKYDNIIVNPGIIALENHEVKLNPKQEAIRKELTAMIDATTMEKFVTFKDLAGNDKERREILTTLVGKKAERLSGDFYVRREIFEEAKAKLMEYFKDHETVNAKQYRDLLGVGRRNAIVLLESFDERKITIRRGDDRILKP